MLRLPRPSRFQPRDAGEPTGTRSATRPRWVAETDSHLIETAMARVVMACALKHHTRRGGAGPPSAGRWPRSSSPMRSSATPGSRCRPTAEAWDGLTRGASLRPPPGRGRRFRRRRQRALRRRRSRRFARRPGPHADSDDGDSDDQTDSAADDSDGRGRGRRRRSQRRGRRRTGTGTVRTAATKATMLRPDAPPSHDPSGTGEVMDADARRGATTASPPKRRWTSPA